MRKLNSKTTLRLTLGSLALAILGSFSSIAKADVWLLKNGRYLEGSQLASDEESITIEAMQDGLRVTIRVLRSDLVSHVPTADGKAGASGSAASSSKLQSQESSAIKSCKKLVIALDASSSMSLGDRFAQALQKVKALIDACPDGARIELLSFGDKVTSVIGGLEKNARFNERLPKILAELKPDSKDGTNLQEALERAIRRRGELTYLVSDGAVTRGAEGAALIRHVEDVCRKHRITTRLGLVWIRSEERALAGVEDLSRIGTCLETLGKSGLGLETVAASPSLDLSASADAPRIEILQPKSGTPIPAIQLGMRQVLPQVRVRVTDPSLREGPWSIAEYGIGLRLEAQIESKEGQVLGTRYAVPLYREGLVLSGTKLLSLVGPVDSRAGRESASEICIPASFSGGNLLLTYTRGAERFTQRIALNGEEVVTAIPLQPVPVGAAPSTPVAPRAPRMAPPRPGRAMGAGD